VTGSAEEQDDISEKLFSMLVIKIFVDCGTGARAAADGRAAGEGGGVLEGGAAEIEGWQGEDGGEGIGRSSGSGDVID
jgi:hypothetical protein